MTVYVITLDTFREGSEVKKVALSEEVAKRHVADMEAENPYATGQYQWYTYEAFEPVE